MPTYRICPFVSGLYILQVLGNNFLAQLFLELNQCNEKHHALTSSPFQGILSFEKGLYKVINGIRIRAKELSYTSTGFRQ